MSTFFQAMLCLKYLISIECMTNLFFHPHQNHVEMARIGGACLSKMATYHICITTRSRTGTYCIPRTPVRKLGCWPAFPISLSLCSESPWTRKFMPLNPCKDVIAASNIQIVYAAPCFISSCESCPQPGNGSCISAIERYRGHSWPCKASAGIEYRLVAAVEDVSIIPDAFLGGRVQDIYLPSILFLALPTLTTYGKPGAGYFSPR